VSMVKRCGAAKFLNQLSKNESRDCAYYLRCDSRQVSCLRPRKSWLGAVFYAKASLALFIAGGALARTVTPGFSSRPPQTKAGAILKPGRERPTLPMLKAFENLAGMASAP
jgi:hypothetical protein